MFNKSTTKEYFYNNRKSNDYSKSYYKIVSYNIYGWKKGKSFESNFQDLIKLLSKIDADIIGLQEVYDNEDKETLENLAEALDLNFAFGGAFINFGNALLTKLPIKSIKKTRLIHWNDEERALLCVNFDNFDVYVTHLDVKSEKVRLNQFEVIQKNISMEKSHFLMGDFNTLRKDDYSSEMWLKISKIRKENFLEILNSELTNKIEENYIDCWSQTQSEKLPTCNYNTRVDYIFYPKKFIDQLKIIKFERIEDHETSDHYPIMLTFELLIEK